MAAISAERPGGHFGARSAVAASAVFALALAVRLWPVLRGGGLAGVLGYDDGVYYGASVAFVHGDMPYRDFLLLHPPGIVVALAPFAEVGRLTAEATGFAAARLTWMLLGCLTAVLVMRVLRPLGLGAAVVGGLFYAVFPPALQVERTTYLEGLANLCLVGALVLLGRRDRGGSRQLLAACVAGVLLGFATSVKIWGVVPLVIVVGYVLLTAGVRVAATVLAGAAAAAIATCAPFFVAAPGAMWRLVVLDQLGRGFTTRTMLSRLSMIIAPGLGLHGVVADGAVLVACAGILGVCLMTWTEPSVRVAVPLLAGIFAMLLLTPSFFAHYAAAAAVPLAVVVGAGVGMVADRLARWRWVVVAIPVALGALLVALAGSALLTHRSGQRFPSAALAMVSSPAVRCVTADDPNTLIQLNVLGRDVDRRCDVVVDLGGYSYDMSSHGMRREDDLRWQQLVLTYFRTGDLTINTRFNLHFGFPPSTIKVIHGWPVRAAAGKIVVRRPTPRLLPGAR